MQITVERWKQKTLIIREKFTKLGSEAALDISCSKLQIWAMGHFLPDLWNTIAIIIMNSGFIRKYLICLFGFTRIRPIVYLVLDFSKSRRNEQKVGCNFSGSPEVMVGARLSLITIPGQEAANRKSLTKNWICVIVIYNWLAEPGWLVTRRGDGGRRGEYNHDTTLRLGDKKLDKQFLVDTTITTECR